MQRLLQRERVTEKGQMALTQRDRGYRSRSSFEVAWEQVLGLVVSPMLLLEAMLLLLRDQYQISRRVGLGCF